MTRLPKPSTVELVDVGSDSVEKLGFFCCMSKRKSEGWQDKLAWCHQRFAEGMRLKLLGDKQRGFIEYGPGEHAWRVVEAKGYLVIHCLWVVGKSKGKGHGAALLQHCIDDARKSKLEGVAVVTSEHPWVPSRRIFERHGFERVDEAPPAFELWAKRFNKRARKPQFPTDWAARAKRFGKGFTVVTTAQCPYNADAVDGALAAAKAHGFRTRVVKLDSQADVQKRAPTAYGTFAMVLDGKLFSTMYLLPKDFPKRLAAFRAG